MREADGYAGGDVHTDQSIDYFVPVNPLQPIPFELGWSGAKVVKGEYGGQETWQLTSLSAVICSDGDCESMR